VSPQSRENPWRREWRRVRGMGKIQNKTKSSELVYRKREYGEEEKYSNYGKRE
jgi:hypothetical protein